MRRGVIVVVMPGYLAVKARLSITIMDNDDGMSCLKSWLSPPSLFSPELF